MSGDNRLVGETELKAKKYLKRVTDILDSRRVLYCLDGGTLLGIVREGRLLPWDNDLDLCVPSSELQKLKRCIPLFWLSGLKVRSRKFEREVGFASSKDLRILKLRNRHFILKKGSVLIDIFIKYPVGKNYVWVEGKGSGLFVNKSVPKVFHDELSYLDFEGKFYPVPADFNGYLTSRYGDWKTPIKEWDYRSDDKAII